MSSNLLFTIVGIDKASAAFHSVSAAVEKTSTTHQKMGAAVKVASAAAAVAVVAFAKSSISAYDTAAAETIKLQRYMGGTATEASRLKFAAQESGVGFDKLSVGMKGLSKSMFAHADAFKNLGIHVKDAHGHLKTMTSIMPELEDKFSHMHAGAEKSALAMKIFGKSGLDMLPFLNKGSAGIAELGLESDKTNNTLSDVSGFKTHIAQERAMNATIEGLKVQLGEHLIPALNATMAKVAELTGWMEKHGTIVKTVVGVVGGLVAGIWLVSKAIDAWAVVQKILDAELFANPIGLVVIAIALLVGGIILAYKHSETFRDIVAGAFDLVRTAGETMWHALETAFTAVATAFVKTKDAISTAVGKVVGFFAALSGDISKAFGDGFGWLHDKATAIKTWVGDKVTNIVRFFVDLPGNIVSGAGDVFSHIKDKAEALRTYIRDKVDAVVGFFTGIPGRLAGKFAGAFDGIAAAFRSAINAAIDVWNNFRIPGVSLHGITIIPSIDTPNLPHLAAGGIVTGPTLALLGEGRHHEAVIPLDGRHSIGGGTTIHLHVTAPVGSNARDIGGELVKYLKAYELGNGKGWRAA